MGETILLVIVLLLALYGCMELIRLVAFRILRPYKQYSGVMVLPVSGHREDMEYLIRIITTRSHWASDISDCVLLVDAGMDKETRELAEDLCRHYDYIRLGSPEEIEKIVTAGLQAGTQSGIMAE